MGRIAEFLGRITGTGTPTEFGGEGAKPGFMRRGFDAVKRGLGAVGEKLGIGGGVDESSLGSDNRGSRAPISGGATFREKAPGVMRRLMDDFGLSKEEAAVVLGNLGHESAGFTAFKEGGNGPGRGWAQWTDPGRKRRFFEYAQKRGLNPEGDEANYGFLKWELENTHKRSIERLKGAKGRDEKMRAFEQDFEGAGVKAYGSRHKYANEAERAFDADEARKGQPIPPASANAPQRAMREIG